MGSRNSKPKQQQLSFDEVTFSRVLGEEAKEEGMELAATSRAELLERVRQALVDIALTRPSREVTADDAQAWLIAQGYTPGDLGNAAGSLFPRDDWLFTGCWKPSSRVSNHAHQNRIWRLK